MSHNLNLVIWEMFYKDILEQAGSGNAFSEHLKAQTLRNLSLGANHGGTFVGLTYVQVCPKKLWIRQSGDISFYINSYMTSEKAKPTALVWHIERFSKSGILNNF